MQDSGNDGTLGHPRDLEGAPAHARRGNILARFSAVPGAGYVNAIIVLYLVTAIFGGWIYTLYRITARLTLEQGHFRWPKIADGVMRLTSAQLAALLEGLDWTRVRAVRIAAPKTAG